MTVSWVHAADTTGLHLYHSGNAPILDIRSGQHVRKGKLIGHSTCRQCLHGMSACLRNMQAVWEFSIARKPLLASSEWASVWKADNRQQPRSVLHLHLQIVTGVMLRHTAKQCHGFEGISASCSSQHRRLYSVRKSAPAVVHAAPQEKLPQRSQAEQAAESRKQRDLASR